MADNSIQVHDVPTIRILILGDKGVGKTSVTNLMAKSEDTPTVASRTVAHHYWDIQVRLHEYTNPVEMPTTSSSSGHSDKTKFPPTPSPPAGDALYFVEFIDVNGESSLEDMQFKELFKNIDGIVLVYNLEDMGSQDNLHDWLYEPLRQICKHRHGSRRPILKTHHVPILVVGTRLDKLVSLPVRGSGIAHQLNAEEILLNGQNPETFQDNARSQQQMHAFLNRVVDFKEQYPLRRSR